MSGIFQRLFKTGQAEAHAIVDKLEDPIKMSEQAIRDLKKDLQESLKALAEVKAISIRLKRESEDHQRRAVDYERKAMLLLQKSQSGQMEDISIPAYWWTSPERLWANTARCICRVIRTTNQKESGSIWRKPIST